MHLKTSSAFPLSALLLIRACHGQQPSSFPSGPFTPGSGPRTVGNSTYTILCEQVNQNALAPYMTTHLATDIKDIDACMALCDSFGQSCEIALWDPAQVNPCTLLTAVPFAQAPPAPTGRCYAAKINGTLPTAVSVPVSFTPGPASVSLPPSGIPFANLSLLVSSDTATLEDTSSTSTETASESGETSSSSSSSIEETSTATTAESSEAIDASPTSVLAASQPERTDALCGSAWPDISLRDCPQADPTWGRCCSRFGFCGNETAFCGFGCLTGFGSCDPPAQAAPIRPSSPSSSSSSSESSSTVQSSTSANPAPSPPFPVWSAFPFFETYYWLPALPVAVWPTPPIALAQSAVGIVSSPFVIPHSVPFSSSNMPLLTPSLVSITSIKTPSPVLPNPPVVDLNTSDSSDLALSTSSVQTPSPVLPKPPVIDISSSEASSDLTAVASAADVSVQPLSLDTTSVPLSISTDVSPSATLPSASFVSSLPVGPSAPVVDISSPSGPYVSASATVSFVA